MVCLLPIFSAKFLSKYSSMVLQTKFVRYIWTCQTLRRTFLHIRNYTQNIFAHAKLYAEYKYLHMQNCTQNINICTCKSIRRIYLHLQNYTNNKFKLQKQSKNFHIKNFTLDIFAHAKLYAEYICIFENILKICLHTQN